MDKKRNIIVYPLLMSILLLLFSCKKDTESQKPTTVTDIDGNVYNIVTIGQQVWMAENLKVTHYNNGDAIPNVTGNVEWAALTESGFCWYNNDIANKDIYGAIYNFQAVIDYRDICPTGWHVPSDREWETLITYLGGGNIAGGKLKEVGSIHWHEPNIRATNETGFTALPSGNRYSDGQFFNLGCFGFWWTNTESYTQKVWYFTINYDNASIYKYRDLETIGFSVRCIKD